MIVRAAVIGILYYLKNHKKAIFYVVLALFALLLVTLAMGKIYQHLDNDPDRGAIGIEDGLFGETYSTPVYLDQGWDAADSLWYYNTTQGSALLPYDFFIALEQPASSELVRANGNMDRYRYLPQKPTFFNPDGLAVGFVKESYQGRDYMGYTCAACHTGQINYQGAAIRIDGGPAMANMVGFLTQIEKALKATEAEPEKQQRFVNAVLELDNDYDSEVEVREDLHRWTNKIELYNTINHSHVDYGYARLDAFGRIYNRVLEHVLNKNQLRNVLLQATAPGGALLLSDEHVDLVLEGIDETIVGEWEFALVLERLTSDKPGYPALSQRQLLRLRDTIFNEPNAPVSYPFLWGITHSDYVQWNGLAGNSAMGPLGRNAGEVIGVFGMLDWSARESGFSLSAYLTGQENKRMKVDFTSSIDLVNLQRLENQLKGLKSPQWPEHILGEINIEKAARGQRIYTRYCQSCHEVNDRNAWDRILISKMSSIDKVGTDPAMAENSVSFRGKSGNFKFVYQNTGVGPVILEEDAPVVQILTAVTTGVVATPDADKWFVRRALDWLYTVSMSFFDNDIKYSIKAGDYNPDTPIRPYQSLLSYKARPLDGIWATAPYLHNGSVPTLYDLLLPKKHEGDPEDGEYRPDTFMVGSREFDPVKIGFRTEGYDGFEFRSLRRGDLNSGHEYASGGTAQLNGEILPTLDEQQRWDLVEYLKTL